jgi:amino acid transporter
VTAVSEEPLPRNRERPPGFRRATLFQLVFMTYAVICSGAYGLEEMVGASGPGLSMLLLVVLPLAYAAPISLTCAELSARFPIEGGYYRWVRLAFGEFAGYTSAWLVWLTMFASNAAYAVLFGNYLRYFLPDLASGGRFLIAAALVWTAVFLNYRGISLVGTASVIFTVLIFVPFVVMTVLGLQQWRFDPLAPFAHPEKPLETALFDGLLIAMWLYGGYEKLTVSAEEVERPARSFPLALTIAVPLCALSYIVPTLAALAANGDWQDWGESHFMKAAAAIGGPALGAAIAAGGLVSNAGILTVTILGQSRLPMVLADDGLFPSLFRKVHPRFGTPVASLILSGVVLTALCGFRFAQLAGVYSLVQSLSYLLIYAALFRLRGRPALGEASGFRIPLGTVGLVAMALPSVFLVSLVVRQGIWPGGAFDARQALLDLAIFASGPLTYLFIRRFSSARRVAVATGMLAVFFFVPGSLGAQPELIRVGMDTRSRPWAYVPGLDYSKEDWAKPPLIQPAQLKLLEGIDIDILNALARRLGASYRIVPRAWGGLEEDLVAGRFDVLMNAWAPSDKTPKEIVASAPYNEWGLVVVARSSDTRIGSYRDLAGRRVGHFKDRVVERTVQSLNAGALVGLDDSDELFDQLLASKLDAVVEDSTYVRWRVARDSRFRVVGERLNRLGYHLGLRREDRDLYAKVQAAIQDFVGSSELDVIRRRWEEPSPGGARR